MRAAGGGAVGLGGAFDPLGRQPDPGQLGEQVGGGGERLGGRGAGGHRAQARRQRGAGDAEIIVAGHDPALADAAVVVGAAQRDPPEHGVEVLVAVADELREMLLAAVDPRPAVPGVGGQQALQQLGAELGHRGADRQLHRRHARPGAQRVRGQRGQPLYLGRERRGDLVAEPPFSSPVVAAGGADTAGFGGRASQIASLTSTICSLTAAKR